MEFLHTKCGGEIDTKTRTCRRCKKHWNWFSFRLTLTEIRPVPAALAKKKPRALRIKPGTTTHAKWGDRIPGVGSVASRLPAWPRWARILVTLVFVVIVVIVVIVLVGR